MKAGGPDRVWRRLAVAAPLSLFVHFLVIMLSRPDYRAVSDVAVNLEVMEAAPGPPPKAPEPPPAPEAPAPEAPKTPPPEQGIAVPKKELVKAHAEPDAGVAAAQREPDAGVRALAQADRDAGVGTGGICLHDLFPFAPADPSWLAWVSMSSFRGTEFERGFSTLLSSFTMYRRMTAGTGLDPGKDVEGFLVTANPFDDASSYRVVATYASGQQALVGALGDSMKGEPGFSLAETKDGYAAAVPGRYRWDLVGSGRVLVVTPEAAPPADAAGLPPAAKPKGHPEWPKDVTCLTAVQAPKFKPGSTFPLALLVRSLIGPDARGHWPALVIATHDPRALGLPRNNSMPAKFVWAFAEVRFSEPMRAEGFVEMAGTKEQVEAVAAQWRATIAAAGADPLLALAGLSGVVDKMKIETNEHRIEFSLPLTSRQIQAALIMLEMQAGSVDQLIERKR